LVFFQSASEGVDCFHWRVARIQGVFLHDPAAGRPKNLDNPFHDAEAQERVGDFIARATRTPERKPPQ
jgi:hypothetical protein